MQYWRATLEEPAMYVEKRHCVDELQALADQDPDRRRFIRLRSVILSLLGWKTLEIVNALGTPKRALQSWVGRFNAEGVDGLTARPKTGRPSLLSAEQLETLCCRIDGRPLPVDETCTLRGPEIRALIERESRRALQAASGKANPIRFRPGYSGGLPRNRRGDGSDDAQPRNRDNQRILEGVLEAIVPHGSRGFSYGTRRDFIQVENLRFQRVFHFIDPSAALLARAESDRKLVALVRCLDLNSGY